MKMIQRLVVTFEKNVCCHIYFINPTTLKPAGDTHFSKSYREFFVHIEKTNVECFAFNMTVSCLNASTINSRINKVKALGFEVTEMKNGHWLASR